MRGVIRKREKGQKKIPWSFMLVSSPNLMHPPNLEQEKDGACACNPSSPQLMIKKNISDIKVPKNMSSVVINPVNTIGLH